MSVLHQSISRLRPLLLILQSILCAVILLTRVQDLPANPTRIASVDGVEINYEQFDECYKLRRAQIKKETLSTKLKDYITFFSMKPFVDQLLITKELKRRGLKVDEAKVNQAIEAAKKTFKTEERFQNYLERMLQTPTSYRVEHWVKEASYLILEADQVIQPTPQELQEKREKIKEKLQVPERVRGRQLMLNLPDGAKPELVNDVFKKIQEIHAMILKEGKDFSIYVQRYSEGPLRGRNGDIGYVSIGDLEPPVEKALWALKDGELSAPFRSRFGWHIIERRDTIAAHERSMNEVSPDLEERLKMIKFNKEHHLYLKRLWRTGNVQTKVNLPPVYRPETTQPPK